MSTREHSAAQEPDFTAVDGGVRERLLAELAGIVPAAALLVSAEDLRPYECDGLSAYRRLPLAVVLAASEARRRRCSGCATGSAFQWWRAAPVPVCRAARCRTSVASCCRWRR